MDPRRSNELMRHSTRCPHAHSRIAVMVSASARTMADSAGTLARISRRTPGIERYNLWNLQFPVQVPSLHLQLYNAVQLLFQGPARGKQLLPQPSRTGPPLGDLLRAGSLGKKLCGLMLASARETVLFVLSKLPGAAPPPSVGGGGHQHRLVAEGLAAASESLATYAATLLASRQQGRASTVRVRQRPLFQKGQDRRWRAAPCAALSPPRHSPLRDLKPPRPRLRTFRRTCETAASTARTARTARMRDAMCSKPSSRGRRGEWGLPGLRGHPQGLQLPRLLQAQGREALSSERLVRLSRVAQTQRGQGLQRLHRGGGLGAGGLIPELEHLRIAVEQ